jgi:AAA+ ATPase superfamily predicted ATPase
MKEAKNPFPVGVYGGPEWFCDRKDECKRLLMNAENGINTTMFSIRRMGKTGLLQHFLTLNQKKLFGIYVDVFATQSLRDFTNSLANAALLTFPEKTSFGTKLMKLIR